MRCHACLLSLCLIPRFWWTWQAHSDTNFLTNGSGACTLVFLQGNSGWWESHSWLVGVQNLIPSPLKAARGNIFWFQRDEVWSTQHYTEQCSGGDRSLEGHLEKFRDCKVQTERDPTVIQYACRWLLFYFWFVFDFFNAFCLSNLSPVGKAYDCDVDFHSEGKLGADKHNWCYYYS